MSLFSAQQQLGVSGGGDTVWSSSSGRRTPALLSPANASQASRAVFFFFIKHVSDIIF